VWSKKKLKEVGVMVKYPIEFRSNVQVLQNFDNLSNYQLDELFVTIYDCIKEDLSLFFKINSLTPAQNFFIAYAQAKQIDALLKEMKRRLEDLATGVCGDYDLFRDTIYHFLRIRCSSRHVYFAEKISYIIASNVHEVKKEDLQQVFKLFDYQFEIYPFYSVKEITFSHWNDIYHVHEYEPNAILNSQHEAFKLFIFYLFLFTVFKKMGRLGLYIYNFMNFNDVYLEFCSSYSKFENILLALSNIYPFLRFFTIDSSDHFRMYSQNQVIEIPSYLYPTKF
jgi:putative component of toxin-antitoxin plasmid stabilization module